MKNTITKPRKGSLEYKLNELLDRAVVSDGPFNVIAYEMTHDGQGWSVNTPFKIAAVVDRAEAIGALMNRWEVFKANYYKKAPVCGISDVGNAEDIELEVDGTPFARIVKV